MAKTHKVHVSDETQQEMCRTPPGMAPDLERGPPREMCREPPCPECGGERSTDSGTSLCCKCGLPSERDQIADMIRRNLKFGLLEGSLRRVLEYLERR